MDDADNDTGIHRNNQPVFHLAFVLLPAIRSVFVVYGAAGVLVFFIFAVASPAKTLLNCFFN